MKLWIYWDVEKQCPWDEFLKSDLDEMMTLAVQQEVSYATEDYLEWFDVRQEIGQRNGLRIKHFSLPTLWPLSNEDF